MFFTAASCIRVCTLWRPCRPWAPSDQENPAPRASMPPGYKSTNEKLRAPFPFLFPATNPPEISGSAQRQFHRVVFDIILLWYVRRTAVPEHAHLVAARARKSRKRREDLEFAKRGNGYRNSCELYSSSLLLPPNVRDGQETAPQYFL